MTIEVVFHTAEGKQVISIENVDSCSWSEETRILTVYDADENDLAEFLNWTYWRKTSD
jgi:hypothetical protein